MKKLILCFSILFLFLPNLHASTVLPQNKVFREQYLKAVNTTTENGEVVLYFPDGGISSSTNWKDGVLNGPLTLYHSNGNIRSRSFFLKGSKEGTALVYRTNGSLAATYSYFNNKYDGPLITYYENKQIEYIIIFEDDKLIAKKKFDPEGNLVINSADTK